MEPGPTSNTQPQKATSITRAKKFFAPPIHRSLSVAPQRLIAWQALDGTICEIWYKQGLSEFHWSIAQSATGPATGKWAEDLRRELGKQSQP